MRRITKTIIFEQTEVKEKKQNKINILFFFKKKQNKIKNKTKQTHTPKTSETEKAIKEKSVQRIKRFLIPGSENQYVKHK